jgi:hypothetical protein
MADTLVYHDTLTAVADIRHDTVMVDMIIENRDGRLFAEGIDTGLPFKEGMVAQPDYARIWAALGRDRVLLAFSIRKPVIRPCRCGAFFLRGWSHQWRRFRCDSCAKAAEKASRQRASKRRSQAREKARAYRRCRHCGSVLAARRSTKCFCSDRCRVKAWRAMSSASASSY